MDNKLLDWQQAAWKTLFANAKFLPHALLLGGPAGTGKGLFAEQLANRLLCESANRGEHACGDCAGCHLLASGNHPDYRKVTLEIGSDEEGAGEPAAQNKSKKKLPATQIKIDQIRALEDFVFIGSHRQGKRVVVIDPADAMNPAAANALLKLLEEPPPSVHFLLVSSNMKRLIPTLRSRCRLMTFGIPDFAASVEWLKAHGVRKPEHLLSLTGGAPLIALKMQEEGSAVIVDEAIEPLYRLPLDPIALAAHWDGLRRRTPNFLLEQLVDIVQRWLYDLTRIRHGGAPRYLLAWQKESTVAATKTSLARLNRFHTELLKIRATVRHPLNELLFLEDLASRCAAALMLPKQ